ncbi:hypothetical protein Poly30_12370 [Planctomycetes bacterium Poly30]|uniref:Collagen triple helix repeat (20 copies) n=1 Tax=Saltatorellus ferox TaxID=2528018 RepID=A0A518ENS5_9BACT|nr:hypothetical protein Poly30_12370 [Planctomycetes bacterium Poly30]
MSSSIRPHAAAILALLLSASPALSQGLGSRDRVSPGSQTGGAPVVGRGYGGQTGQTGQTGPTGQTGQAGQPAPYGQPTPYGQAGSTTGGAGQPGQPGQFPAPAPAPADTYAGQWKGQASWPLPGGVMMTFPVTVDVEREGQGYRMRYSAEIPAQSPDIQPSPTRWTGTFRGGVQQNPGSPQGYPQQGQNPYGQPTAPVPAFSFLMGESQDYSVQVLNTGQTQGPWYVSIGLMAENGRLSGQVGSPQIGFAQFQLDRAGAMPGFPGQPGQPNQPGFPGQPAANTLQGQWSGTASDTLDNGQPIQFPAQLNVTQDPATGQVRATYSSTIPYPDPESGQTVQLLVEETFTGTMQNGKASLSCPNVRILEARSRQMLTSFPARLELTLGAQGITGSLGSEEMGYTQLQLQRSTGAPGGMNPGGMNPGGMNPGGWNPGGYGPQGPNSGGWGPGGQQPGGWDQSGWDQEGSYEEYGTWSDIPTGSGW